MMAASLKGSRPAANPCRPSGRIAGPAPRDGLSRTRVAISTETPSGLECCAERAVCGLLFSSVDEDVRVPERWPPELAIRSVKSAPERLEPAESNPANPGLPEAKAGHNATIPSGGKPAALRIDLAFQRMESMVQVPAGPF